MTISKAGHRLKMLRRVPFHERSRYLMHRRLRSLLDLRAEWYEKAKREYEAVVKMRSVGEMLTRVIEGEVHDTPPTPPPSRLMH